MLNRIFLFVFSLFSSLLFSCQSENTGSVIAFTSDSSKIVIKNIQAVNLLQVKNSFKENLDSTYLISVYLTPGENDSLTMEHRIDGNIKLEGDSLMFYPKQPFEKGKTYLVETVIGMDFANSKKILTGKLKSSVQRQKQLLVR
ncbi:hypothetical protein [Pedobacter sp. MW01-1-1]|uniref:hypothetical protein n=1 Tax=Pedobacter sp. MW01-1-1 TaxID=3383027 RepID=UPI003FED4717